MRNYEMINEEQGDSETFINGVYRTLLLMERNAAEEEQRTRAIHEKASINFERISHTRELFEGAVSEDVGTAIKEEVWSQSKKDTVVENNYIVSPPSSLIHHNI